MLNSFTAASISGSSVSASAMAPRQALRGSMPVAVPELFPTVPLDTERQETLGYQPGFDPLDIETVADYAFPKP